jgi:hypothetical protein
MASGQQVRGDARAGRRVIQWIGEQGFIVIFLIWAIYLALNTRNFATANNLFTVLRQASIIGVVAIGAHYIILLGDIDLSLAANLSLSGVVMASLMVNNGLPPLAAALVSLALGATIGLVNGLVITRLKINAIITTLGMMKHPRRLGVHPDARQDHFRRPDQQHQVSVERHAVRRDSRPRDHSIRMLRHCLRGAAPHDLRHLRVRQWQQRQGSVAVRRQRQPH